MHCNLCYFVQQPYCPQLDAVQAKHGPHFLHGLAGFGSSNHLAPFGYLPQESVVPADSLVLDPHGAQLVNDNLRDPLLELVDCPPISRDELRQLSGSARRLVECRPDEQDVRQAGPEDGVVRYLLVAFGDWRLDDRGVDLGVNVGGRVGDVDPGQGARVRFGHLRGGILEVEDAVRGYWSVSARLIA